MIFIFFFQAEDGIRDKLVTGVQTCALPISDEEATAPAATTPLMKLRREADCRTSSDIILSSIAGSPRRAGGPTGRRGILSRTRYPLLLSGSNDFRGPIPY